MSSEERRKILQMVADRKISAEEAATLMRALDEDQSVEEQVEIIEARTTTSQERSEAPELKEVRKRASRFSSAFIWMGILFTVFSAWVMFAVQQGSGLNFWFYCFSMPLFFGILLIALGAGSKTSRWLYVNVDRSQSKKGQDGPRKISLAFPLPIGLAGWFLKTFGSKIDGLKNTNVDDVVQVLSMTKNITDPLIIHVDDSDDGEKVQVFIG